MKLSSIFILVSIFISFFTTAHAEQIASGKFVFIRGDVTINRLINNKLIQVKAQNNDAVYKLDVIETASNAAARIRLVDSNQIDIYPKTKVSVSEYIYKPAENKKNVELNIDYGKIQSTVRQKYDGTKNTYRVKTPGIVAGVRGTIFTVGYESGLSSTSVTEGIVDVRINSPDGEKVSEASGALVRPQQKIQFISSQKKIEVASFSREDIEKIKSEREVFKEADAKSKTDSKIEADKEIIQIQKQDQSINNKQPQKDSKFGSSTVSPERKSEGSALQSPVESTPIKAEHNGQKIKAKDVIRSDRAEEALQNARGQQIKETVGKNSKGIEKSAAEVSAERRSEALQKKLKELNTLTKTTNADTKENIKQQAEENERRKAEEAAAEAKRLAEEARKKAEEAAAKEKAESSN